MKKDRIRPFLYIPTREDAKMRKATERALSQDNPRTKVTKAQLAKGADKVKTPGRRFAQSVRMRKVKVTLPSLKCLED